MRDGKLVVFAGAGVSMGEPACLPDFKELALQIAEGTGESMGKDEPIDHFLGRLRKKENLVDIYGRAKDILDREGLENTPLHKSLLQSFRNADDMRDMRIVTTNFDLLFEKAAEAAKDIDESKIEIFRAPALPLGDKFCGIIHVHGSVLRQDEMVLTDSDFGKAYLMEGWARRFMVGLHHSEYRILFVGYSHEDTILNYLVRALPSEESEQQRFALAKKDDDPSKHQKNKDHWNWLGIRPIFYPPSPKPAEHEKLTEGVKELAEFVNRRISGWREILERQLQRSPNDLDAKELSHIEYAIHVDELAELIWMTAASPDWIDWFDQKGFLERVLQ